MGLRVRTSMTSIRSGMLASTSPFAVLSTPLSPVPLAVSLSSVSFPLSLYIVIITFTRRKKNEKI